MWVPKASGTATSQNVIYTPPVATDISGYTGSTDAVLAYQWWCSRLQVTWPVVASSRVTLATGAGAGIGPGGAYAIVASQVKLYPNTYTLNDGTGNVDVCTMNVIVDGNNQI